MSDRWEVMSEHCREQRPLLCDDLSEDEPFSLQYNRRIRPKTHRGRIKNNLKGAAAILSRWPDHWSSFLIYLWIGIGMISLSTFIIYNSLFAISIFPSVNLRPASVVINKNEETSDKILILPDVYIHVFVSQSEDINYNPYMPYIDILSNTFLDFNFNLIMVINDTNIGWMSAEENNELALNTLWSKENSDIKKAYLNQNINIEHVTLSAYMDDSPLRKYWRTLPYQLIEFLVRTVSIWDKGGVAFNPDILTPKFQYSLYIEKLQNILNKYAHSNKFIDISKTIPINKTQEKHKKLNNIRDIMEALEDENISTNAFSQQTLIEAETRDIKSRRHDYRVNTVTETLEKKTYDANEEPINRKQHKIMNKSNSLESVHNNITESANLLEISHNITKKNLLPLFLEYLFHNKAGISAIHSDESVITNRTRKSVFIAPESEENISVENKLVKHSGEEIRTRLKPVIVSAKNGRDNKSAYGKFTKTSKNKEAVNPSEPNNLAIDLKGYIIATDTPCHAFLGTIFSNSIHHTEAETVTDFIIAELTMFCNGLLSSCAGIDLILL